MWAFLSCFGCTKFSQNCKDDKATEARVVVAGSAPPAHGDKGIEPCLENGKQRPGVSDDDKSHDERSNVSPNRHGSTSRRDCQEGQDLLLMNSSPLLLTVISSGPAIWPVMHQNASCRSWYGDLMNPTVCPSTPATDLGILEHLFCKDKAALEMMLISLHANGPGSWKGIVRVSCPKEQRLTAAAVDLLERGSLRPNSQQLGGHPDDHGNSFRTERQLVRLPSVAEGPLQGTARMSSESQTGHSAQRQQHHHQRPGADRVVAGRETEPDKPSPSGTVSGMPESLSLRGLNRTSSDESSPNAQRVPILDPPSRAPCISPVARRQVLPRRDHGSGTADGTAAEDSKAPSSSPPRTVPDRMLSAEGDRGPFISGHLDTATTFKSGSTCIPPLRSNSTAEAPRIYSPMGGSGADSRAALLEALRSSTFAMQAWLPVPSSIVPPGDATGNSSRAHSLQDGSHSRGSGSSARRGHLTIASRSVMSRRPGRSCTFGPLTKAGPSSSRALAFATSLRTSPLLEALVVRRAQDRNRDAARTGEDRLEVLDPGCFASPTSRSLSQADVSIMTSCPVVQRSSMSCTTRSRHVRFGGVPKVPASPASLHPAASAPSPLAAADGRPQPLEDCTLTHAGSGDVSPSVTETRDVLPTHTTGVSDVFSSQVRSRVGVGSGVAIMERETPKPSPGVARILEVKKKLAQQSAREVGSEPSISLTPPRLPIEPVMEVEGPASESVSGFAHDTCPGSADVAAARGINLLDSRVAGGRSTAAASPGAAGGEDLGGPGFSDWWHEVWANRSVDPATGRNVIVVVQHDITAKVRLERHLALVMETGHRLLEQIFPRHVLQYITENSTSAAALGGVLSAAGAPNLNQLTPLGRRTPPASPYDCNSLATWHPQVTLLFADIEGFTPMCRQVEPRAVMATLNDLFSRFDALLDQYGVFKVETIGDCYFVAGGLMHEDEDGMAVVRDERIGADPLHAQKVFMFAKAMIAVAKQVVLPSTGKPVSIRIGMHSGPVVSGIVGTRMPRFCLFGDTVNTASRMESTGVAGAIHASDATYELLSKECWKPTGGLEVKGKGLMHTYLWHPQDLDLPSRPAPLDGRQSTASSASLLANYVALRRTVLAAGSCGSMLASRSSTVARPATGAELLLEAAGSHRGGGGDDALHTDVSLLEVLLRGTSRHPPEL